MLIYVILVCKYKWKVYNKFIIFNINKKKNSQNLIYFLSTTSEQQSNPIILSRSWNKATKFNILFTTWNKYYFLLLYYSKHKINASILTFNPHHQILLSLWCFFGAYWAKRKLTSWLFMKSKNEFSCLFGHNIIYAKKTTELNWITEFVLLFHKKTIKLIFFWPNMGIKASKC